MTGPNPYDYIWWLASRASGIVALGLVTASVGIGLLMASKLLRRPGLNRVLVKLHEHLALTGLVAIAVHGITLLGDRWLNPGVGRHHGAVHDVLPPAVHRARHRRRLPGGAARPVVLRAAPDRGAAVAQAPQGDVAVYVLGVVHALGAGTDASTIWLRAFLLVTGAPILFLLLVRFLPRRKSEVERARSRTGGLRVGRPATAEGKPS